MCHSETLDKAGAYAEPDGWVYLAWKGVIVSGSYLLPPAPWFCAGEAVRSLFGDPKSSVYHAVGTWAEKARRESGAMLEFLDAFLAVLDEAYGPIRHLNLQPRTLLEDGHGFHVAATYEGARNFMGRSQFDAVPEWDAEDPCAVGWAICRCLVPERAIDNTAHCHAVVIVPPNERETQRELDLCGAWARTHRGVPLPWLTPEQGRMITQLRFQRAPAALARPQVRCSDSAARARFRPLEKLKDAEARVKQERGRGRVQGDGDPAPLKVGGPPIADSN